MGREKNRIQKVVGLPFSNQNGETSKSNISARKSFEAFSPKGTKKQTTLDYFHRLDNEVGLFNVFQNCLYYPDSKSENKGDVYIWAKC